eukprot:TRINITY_DN3332_c0_g1_i1.p1 TRINITY_DN3332_c0_g1~~TRINITY_DN3332_c0_g1_i1.p1  ORF type:complete len:528 (-),score=124.41 TRINITY_DN3332_c0_g1_i1:85-1668(-)
MMLRMLVLYSRSNPYLSYKQGMHELLAPILIVVFEDANRNTEELSAETKDFISFLCRKEYIEHDSYLIFLKVMEVAAPWFISGMTDSLNSSQSGLRSSWDVIYSSPISRKCLHIQELLLKQKDPELHAHLSKLAIEPQLYAIRWIRVIFSREFCIQDLLLLWDAIFANDAQKSENELMKDQKFILLDYIAVSMLSSIRYKLIGHDPSENLNVLLSFPACSSEQTKQILFDAISLINGGSLNLAHQKKTKADKEEETSGTEEKEDKKAEVFPSFAFSPPPSLSSSCQSESGEKKSLSDSNNRTERPSSPSQSADPSSSVAVESSSTKPSFASGLLSKISPIANPLSLSPRLARNNTSSSSTVNNSTLSSSSSSSSVLSLSSSSTPVSSLSSTSSESAGGFFKRAFSGSSSVSASNKALNDLMAKYMEAKETIANYQSSVSHVSHRLDRVIYSLVSQFDISFPQLGAGERECLYVAVTELFAIQNLLLAVSSSESSENVPPSPASTSLLSNSVLLDQFQEKWRFGAQKD